jgi:hypothetical protein
VAKRGKQVSKALQPAPSEQRAPTADDRAPPAATGAEASVNNAGPAPAESETVVTAAVAGAPVPVCEFVSIAFPLPAGIPPLALEGSSIVVKAKPARGRWRAGRQFTREETVIPFGDLTEQQIAALAGDVELIVSLRVPKPA